MPADELLNVSQIAKTLGVSRMTVYRMRDDGELPFIQVRGRYKCRRSEIERYLDEQVVEPRGKIRRD